MNRCEKGANFQQSERHLTYESERGRQLLEGISTPFQEKTGLVQKSSLNKTREKIIDRGSGGVEVCKEKANVFDCR